MKFLPVMIVSVGAAAGVDAVDIDDDNSLRSLGAKHGLMIGAAANHGVVRSNHSFDAVVSFYAFFLS